MFSLSACVFVLLLAAVHSVHAFAFEAALSIDPSAVLRKVSTTTAHKKAFKVAKNSYLALTKTTNAENSCRWNAATKSCAIGYGALSELLGDSSDAYAQFVAKFAECLAAVDGEACAAKPDCIWDTDDSICRFVDFYTGHENSPCVSGADGTMHSIVASEMCALHKTQLDCYKDPLCEWNGDGLMCESDGFTFWIGVPFSQLTEASNAVVLYKVSELKALFISAFDFESKDFKYEDILKWKIPKTSCPDWSDPLVCTYADGVVSTLSQTFYCATRHAGPDGLLSCILDPQCIIDEESATCRQPDDTFGPGVFKGIKDIVATYVKAPVDKKILNQILDCNTIREKDACSSPCAWSETEYEDDECDIEDAWVAQAIADAGNGSDDVICKYIRDAVSATCLGIHDIDICAAKSACSVQLSGACWVSVDFQTNGIIKMDKTLEKAYNTLAATCSSYKTEKECLGVE